MNYEEGFNGKIITSRRGFNEHAKLNLIGHQRNFPIKDADFLLVLGVPTHFRTSFAKSRSNCAKSGDFTEETPGFENHALFVTNGAHLGQDGGRRRRADIKIEQKSLKERRINE